MQNLFGEDEVAKVRNSKNKSGKYTKNPCIAVYGIGPEGTRCKTCSHLYGKQYGKTYYKCDLRKISNGPATDHRVNFPSCGKYIKRE